MIIRYMSSSSVGGAREVQGALRQSHDSCNYIAATCVYFMAMKVVFDLPVAFCARVSRCHKECTSQMPRITFFSTL